MEKKFIMVHDTNNLDSQYDSFSWWDSGSGSQRSFSAPCDYYSQEPLAFLGRTLQMMNT